MFDVDQQGAVYCDDLRYVTRVRRTLTLPAFLARGAAVLSEYGVENVLCPVLGQLGADGDGYAYFHNPHVVLSMQLEDRWEPALAQALASLWDAHRSSFVRQHEHDRGCGPLTEGVHEGRAEHHELYVDLAGAEESRVLHARGQSFRIRISRSCDNPSDDDVRVLLVATQSPLGTGLDAANLSERWSELSEHSMNELAELLPERDWLAERGFVPSIADCLTIFTRGWQRCVDALHALSNELAALQLRVLTRNSKRTIRTVLRPWHQDPVSGIMQPDWAYAVMDDVTLTSVSDVTLSLTQIEIEAGPSLSEITQAAQLFDGLQQLLVSRNVPFQRVYGRKYHRLLPSLLV